MSKHKRPGRSWNPLAWWRRPAAPSVRQQRSPNRVRLTVEELEPRIVPTLYGQNIFPTDNPIHQNIANAPVLANSGAITNSLLNYLQSTYPSSDPGPFDGLVNVIGAASGNGPYGTKFNIVHSKSVTWTNVVDSHEYTGNYFSNVSIPIPSNVVVNPENYGQPGSNQGVDQFMIIWDQDTNTLWETYHTYRPGEGWLGIASSNGATESGNTVTIATNGANNLSVGQSVTIAGVGVAGYNGTFTVTNVIDATHFQYMDSVSGLAASGKGTIADNNWHVADYTSWNLNTDDFENGRTAGGMSYWAMMDRPDEGLPQSEGGQGVIDHALYLELDSQWMAEKAWLYPAQNLGYDSAVTPNGTPFGIRLRLKANVDISGLNPQSQILATALKNYGAIMDDTIGSGVGMAIGAVAYTPDTNNNWDGKSLSFATYGGLSLNLPITDFEWVDVSPQVTGLSETSGKAGDTITITGKNFSYANPITTVNGVSVNSPGLSVLFGGQAATNVTVVNDTTITATVPNAPANYGTVAVQVMSGVNQAGLGLPGSNLNSPVFGYGLSKQYVTFTYGSGATQSDPSAPPAPTDLTATVGNGQVTLNWSPVSGATSYNLYRSTVGGKETLYQSGVSPGYTDTGVTNGTTYYYQVVAVNSIGTSRQSNEAAAMPNPLAPVMDSSFQWDNTATDTLNGQPSELPGFSSYDWEQAAYSSTSGTTYYPNPNWGGPGNIGFGDQGSNNPHDPAAMHNQTIAGVWNPTTDTWATNAIAANLTDTNIGSPAQSGSASYDSSTGTWTVTGGGAGIGSTSDQFNFASNGSLNGTAFATVTSVSSGASAGLMWRDYTNSTFSPTSAYAFLYVSGNTVGFEGRTSNGGTTRSYGTATVSGPVWLKLGRSGTGGYSITAWYSTDGNSWTQLGSTQEAVLSGTAQVGFAVTANNNSQLATATFTNTLTGVTTPFPNGGYDGNQVAWVDGYTAGSNYNYIVQQTNVVFQANTTYTLTVAVGDRTDAAFGGYQVELLYGSINPITGVVTGTMLNSAVSTQAPVAGGFGDVTVTYTTPSSGSMIGQNLLIVLATNPANNAKNTQAGPGVGNSQVMPQTDFDNVRLTTQSVSLTDQDINGSTPAGSASYSNGVWTVSGGGQGINGKGGTSDQFNFASEPVSASATVVAELTSFNGTNYTSFAGIMLRNSTAAGAAFASMNWAPGWGVLMFWRSSDGSGAAYLTGPRVPRPSSTNPLWLELVQNGSTITSYESPDGTNWTEVGSATVSLNASFLAGLAVSSEYKAPLVTATFANLNVDPSPPAPNSATQTTLVPSWADGSTAPNPSTHPADVSEPRSSQPTGSGSPLGTVNLAGLADTLLASSSGTTPPASPLVNDEQRSPAPTTLLASRPAQGRSAWLPIWYSLEEALLFARESSEGS